MPIGAKFWIFTFIAACGAVAGLLSAPIVRAQDPQQRVTVDGIDRTFVVHLPNGYDSKKKYPMVLLLHGTGQNAIDMTRLTRFDAAADKYGVVAVYPNSYGVRWDIGVVVEQPNFAPRPRRGYGRRGGYGYPGSYPGSGPYPGGGPGGDPQGGGRQGRNGQATRGQANDLAFFDQMLDKLTHEYPVDTSRIFATGYSDGGFMAFRLGCSMSGRIAAIAPVAATMPKEMQTWCHPSRAVPLVMLNGTADTVIHYYGGNVKGMDFPALSAEKTAQTWAELDRCTAKPTHTTLQPHDKHGMKTRVDTYDDCRDGAEVVLYNIDGGGNTWPGGDQFMPEKEVGKMSMDVDADEVIWKFFSAHPIPSSSSAAN